MVKFFQTVAPTSKNFETVRLPAQQGSMDLKAFRERLVSAWKRVQPVGFPDVSFNTPAHNNIPRKGWGVLCTNSRVASRTRQPVIEKIQDFYNKSSKRFNIMKSGKRVFVQNLENTRDLKAGHGNSWIAYWEKHSGEPAKSCARCGSPHNLEGAHVKKVGDENTYIVPLCSKCNKKDGFLWVNEPLVDAENPSRTLIPLIRKKVQECGFPYVFRHASPNTVRSVPRSTLTPRGL